MPRPRSIERILRNRWAPARLATGAVLVGAMVVLPSCSGQEDDEFRAGIEDGFSDAGLDLDDAQVDCVTDRVVRALGGQDRIDELTDDYDSLAEVPDSVQARVTDATTDALEACKIDVTDTTAD